MIERPGHIAYLDGLRGAAALYIVLYHAQDVLLHGGTLARTNLLPFHGRFLSYGHSAVGILIVISGFVLSLPLAKCGLDACDARGFVVRRMRRLLPAYYAALTLALPLYLMRLDLEHLQTTPLAVAIQYVAHALLLHDLFARTIYSIDGPLWTVAVMLQTYVIFAFAIVPAMRRFGIAAGVALAFAIGTLPALFAALFPHRAIPLQYAYFWYVGVFALGSAAARIVYDPALHAVRERIAWKTLSFAAFAWYLWLALPLPNDRFGNPQFLTSDIVLGLAVSAGFIAVSNDVAAGRRSAIAAIFSAKPLVALGTISYSLYLVHQPLEIVAIRFAQALPAGVTVVLTFVAIVPLVIALAYAFARAFEFPFLSARPKRKIAIVRPTRAPLPR